MDKTPLVIRPSMDILPQPMISASDEAGRVKYHMYKGKSGKRWLVGDVPDAENYVFMEGGPGSRGFGGRTLTFELVDGSTVEWTGPWKESARVLREDTGVDVRGTAPEYFVIALHRQYGRGSQVTRMIGVLYVDVVPMSLVDRVNSGLPYPPQLAEEFADKLGHSVLLHCDFKGGGYTKPVNPVNAGNGRRTLYVEPPVKKEE